MQQRVNGLSVRPTGEEMPLRSKADARCREKLGVKDSATTRRLFGLLYAKRHAQQCRSICAVDCEKDTIQNVIEKAHQGSHAEQLAAKRRDESEIVAGMQKKRGPMQ